MEMCSSGEVAAGFDTIMALPGCGVHPAMGNMARFRVTWILLREDRKTSDIDDATTIDHHAPRRE